MLKYDESILFLSYKHAMCTKKQLNLYAAKSHKPAALFFSITSLYRTPDLFLSGVKWQMFAKITCLLYRTPVQQGSARLHSY